MVYVSGAIGLIEARRKLDRTESLMTNLKIELLGLLHDSPVERLKRADIVRKKLGKSPDLLC